ncbi:MAG TPA: CDP-alcohol phosphatidyltransferase family protein [Micrococcaceae bacterium]|nr:CDP-alcohol phosphatidyltransferase family protein [Micrococcaceae bacterium]
MSAGLGPAGWAVGLPVGWAWTALLALARLRSEKPAIFPADWVTLTRALLSAGAAGLVVESFVWPLSVTALVSLSTVALVLDAVDGQVARRTGTANPLGARFDGEVDAFLILLLSIAVSQRYGGWVLIIGAARYLLLLAGLLVPALAAPLPPRYWGKFVAAVQGIVLTVAISGLLDRLIGMIAVALALILLVQSFGHDIIWLCRTGLGARSRRMLRGAVGAVSALIVWAVLAAPDQIQHLRIGAFVRVPIEALVLIAAAVVLPGRPRQILAAIAGVLFGLITAIKILDMGFYEELGRPFEPLFDWGNLSPAIGVVRDSIGATATSVGLVVVGLALAAVVGMVATSTVHLSAVAARHRRGSLQALAALATVWAVSLGLSLQLIPGVPVASTSAAGIAVAQVGAVRDQLHFEAAIHADDSGAGVPASNLLTGLQGKDVLIVFVESYGQVAVQGNSFSGGVDQVLRNRTTALTQAGWSSQSAWLTSPTFGGISWLAHSTLQSGLWVDSQQRYDQLVASNRFTLSGAFGKAGWRTVSDIPSDDEAWPAGTSFYHYDQFYDRRNVGYHGPTFSYASMPDQYSLAAFERNELQPGHKPVMAEIDLVSSHTPWTPLPSMVPWSQLGDGSIFNPMPALGLSPSAAWSDTNTVRQLYGQSIQYSLQALATWVTELNDPNLVLVMLGDHQPATTVSGAGANHEVPISIIARDPSVFAKISPWSWGNGLLPSPSAPVWSMDAFRDKFLTAFSTPRG